MGTYRSEEVIDAYETRRVETHQMPAVTAGSSVSANNQGGNQRVTGAAAQIQANDGNGNDGHVQ